MDPHPFDSLFTGVEQYENFAALHRDLPTSTMAPSAAAVPLPSGPQIGLPETYVFDGRERASDALLDQTRTTSLLVLVNGVVRHESYGLTGRAEAPWISWSIAKSFVSALVGIAIADGHIGGIDEPISDYVAVAPGSAYDNVLIRDVLQMSSGARWNEDYSDPGSDIFRLGDVLRGVGTLNDFVATMVPELQPGTVCRYNSGDTQALGSLLTAATGRPLTGYMTEKLHQPLDMTGPGHWLVDRDGTEMVFGGLSLAARDFARLGELYRNGGKHRGIQVVPADWVNRSAVADAPHLQPGRPTLGAGPVEFGYGYQWWLPAGDRGEFAAIGVYNQYVYVDPTAGVTIVKLSATPTYGTTQNEAENRGGENITFLRAVARHCQRFAEAAS